MFKHRGFTLIEILVTLVIMMFGMLGLAGLIIKGQRASYEAYQRNQALALAADMVERLKANAAEQINSGIYTTGTGFVGDGSLFGDLGGSIIDCRRAACLTPNDLARYDLAIWDGLLLGSSESFGGAVRGGINNARGCIKPAPGLAANTFRVTVVWQGDANTTPPAFADDCASTEGSLATRHVISLDVALGS